MEFSCRSNELLNLKNWAEKPEGQAGCPKENPIRLAFSGVLNWTGFD
jgi:hypothetical protein